MVPANIFKSYDIRGIYPSELNEDSAFLIGKAFVGYTGAKNIAIGYDMRLSSPQLSESIKKGIMESGCNVYDLGQVSTEMIYFAVGKRGYDAAVMVTASHNPKEYNGFKLIKKDENGFSMVRGKDLYKTVNNSFTEKKKGKIKRVDIKKEYIKYVLSLFKSKKVKPFNIVVDAGSGMASVSLPLLQKKLPVKILPLNFELDGSFPSHPSNPLEKGVTDQIKEKIILEKADFGFIFDGDADRIFLVDEKGELVPGDATLLLLSKYFLQKHPGSAISYNLICSKAVPELIAKWGGKPVRSAVGFVNVRESMINTQGILGGELSGHFCFKDNFYGDSGVIAFLALLNILSESDKKVSEIVKDVSPYVKSAEINFEVQDKEKIIESIKSQFEGSRDFLDGVTISYDNWWFNVRPSNTEPLLRLTIEADNEALLLEKKEEITKFINSIT